MSNEELQILEANFQFVQTEPIGATFTISPSGQDFSFIHYQDSPEAIWTINHNSNKYPSVTVVTSAGDVVYTDIRYVDENTIRLEFNGAFAGKAFIN